MHLNLRSNLPILAFKLRSGAILRELNREEHWESPASLGDFGSPRVFVLTQDVPYIRNRIRLHALIGSRNFHWKDLSHEEFHELGMQILPAGTRLQFIRFSIYANVSMTVSFVYAEILDGPMAGTVMNVQELTVIRFHDELVYFLKDVREEFLSEEEELRSIRVQTSEPGELE